MLPLVTMSPVVCGSASNSSMAVVLRELKNDLYGPLAVGASTFTMQIPIATLCALALMLPGFIVLDWTFNAFGEV